MSRDDNGPAQARPSSPVTQIGELFDKACERHTARLARSYAPDRIRFLRAAVWSYARDLMVFPLLGDGDLDENAEEIWQAVFGLGKRVGASKDELLAAANAVLSDAREASINLVQHLRRGLWRMAAARAPAALLMAEAQRIVEKHDGYLPETLLVEACRLTVAAAAPKRGRRRYGGR